MEFTWDGPAVYPEYLTDLNILICPSDSDGNAQFEAGLFNPIYGATSSPFFAPDAPVDPCAIAPISYTYVGWTTSAEGIRLPSAVSTSDLSTAALPEPSCA